MLFFLPVFGSLWFFFCAFLCVCLAVCAFFCAFCGAIFCECVSKFVLFFCAVPCVFLWVCLCFPVCAFSMGSFVFFSGNHVWLFVFFVLSAVLFFVPVFGSLCFFVFCGVFFCLPVC